MRLRSPSPGTVISTIALVMATTGTAVAAVDFARNAGAVDGVSAVGASSSNSRAKGNLVATARGGSNTGQIPNKFLADVPRVEGVRRRRSPSRTTRPARRSTSASTPLGRFSASCQDQSMTAGTEDPRMVLSFTNQSGGPANIARRAGVGEANVGLICQRHRRLVHDRQLEHVPRARAAEHDAGDHRGRRPSGPPGPGQRSVPRVGHRVR